LHSIAQVFGQHPGSCTSSIRLPISTIAPALIRQFSRLFLISFSPRSSSSNGSNSESPYVRGQLLIHDRGGPSTGPRYPFSIGNYMDINQAIALRGQLALTGSPHGTCTRHASRYCLSALASDFAPVLSLSIQTLAPVSRSGSFTWPLARHPNRPFSSSGPPDLAIVSRRSI
jgi:hypothetical protein